MSASDIDLTKQKKEHGSNIVVPSSSCNPCECRSSPSESENPITTITWISEESARFRAFVSQKVSLGLRDKPEIHVSDFRESHPRPSSSEITPSRRDRFASPSRLHSHKIKMGDESPSSKSSAQRHSNIPLITSFGTSHSYQKVTTKPKLKSKDYTTPFPRAKHYLVQIIGAKASGLPQEAHNYRSFRRPFFKHSHKLGLCTDDCQVFPSTVTRPWFMRNARCSEKFSEGSSSFSPEAKELFTETKGKRIQYFRDVDLCCEEVLIGQSDSCEQIFDTDRDSLKMSEWFGGHNSRATNSTSSSFFEAERKLKTKRQFFFQNFLGALTFIVEGVLFYPRLAIQTVIIPFRRLSTNRKREQSGTGFSVVQKDFQCAPSFSSSEQHLQEWVKRSTLARSGLANYDSNRSANPAADNTANEVQRENTSPENNRNAASTHRQYTSVDPLEKNGAKTTDAVSNITSQQRAHVCRQKTVAGKQYCRTKLKLSAQTLLFSTSFS